MTAADVEEVVMLGRRGPAQAAFTNPELRELGEMTRADVQVDPGSSSTNARWLEEEGSPTAKRNVDILAGLRRAPTGLQGAPGRR